MTVRMPPSIVRPTSCTWFDCAASGAAANAAVRNKWDARMVESRTERAGTADRSGTLASAPVTASPVQLPEFPASLHWLDRPALQVATGLRGHVAAVLFWRLGCVHCRHALAELASLQSEFADRPFAVVGLHVPTSAGERDDARLTRT